MKIKEFWEKYKIIIIILFLVVCNIFLFKIFLDTYNSKSNLIDMYKAQEDTIKTFKDKNNILHSRIAVIESNKKNIEYLYGAKIDSLTKLLKVKDKQIIDYISIVKSTKGQFKSKIDTIILKDTIDDTGLVFGTDTIYSTSYSDKWLNFKGRYSTAEDQFTGEYKVKDSLTIVSIEKKYGLFGLGRRELFLDISSANPNTEILNIRNFRITQEKAKRFGIGPFVGLGYDGKFKAIWGIGVTYSIIKF